MILWSVLFVLGGLNVEIEFLSSDALIEYENFFASHLKVRLWVVAACDEEVVVLAIASRCVEGLNVSKEFKNTSEKLEGGTDFKLGLVSLNQSWYHGNIETLGAHCVRWTNHRDVDI